MAKISIETKALVESWDIESYMKRMEDALASGNISEYKRLAEECIDKYPMGEN
jgi:hypothetical protein